MDKITRYINQNQARFYLANFVTLSFYGFFYLAFSAKRIGIKVGERYPGPLLFILFTLLTVGIYAIVMLPLLTYKLDQIHASSYAKTVLILSVSYVAVSMFSSGILIFISIALWAHATWLLLKAESNNQAKFA